MNITAFCSKCKSDHVFTQQQARNILILASYEDLENGPRCLFEHGRADTELQINPADPRLPWEPANGR